MPKSHIDRVFHALGDPTCRVIVEKLSEGFVSVSRLAEPLDITLAAVVRHLEALERSGWCIPKGRDGTHLSHRTYRAYRGEAMEVVRFGENGSIA